MPPRKKQNGIPANAIILGFTGSLGSGCSYIAEGIANELTEYKFVSLSAPIYEKAGTGAPKSKLQDVGDNLRREYGRHFLAKEAIDGLKSSGETHKRIIINSIRNDQEVLYLRQFPNFYLFSIYAPRDVRFKRLKKEHYGEDRSSFDKDDERDSKNIDPFGQQVSKCNYLADIVINNQDIPPSSSH
jgi:dephospho-CoA kinase